MNLEAAILIKMRSFLKGDFSAVLQQLTIKVQLNESNQTNQKK